tara:strand:+ start:644 stop:778 length:135 start_codon:yes stop_codon:yes gene_type:complete
MHNQLPIQSVAISMMISEAMYKIVVGVERLVRLTGPAHRPGQQK